MASLEIRNLRKSFGALQILNDVNVRADDGEFMVLLGPSGCGKSTLLSAIAGLDHVDGGQILIDGRDVVALEPKARDIAMVFQSYALYPSMTVRQNICFGMKVRGVPKRRQETEVARVADMLQLTPMLDRRPAQLSGGQRQRVAMGRALVRDPKLFLFDEPLSNLDALLRVEMRTEIKKLHQRVGTTVVYVTHDQIEAMTLATKIVVMRGGVIQQIGTPQEVYDRPANLYVAGFIGSPPMNLISGVLHMDASGARVRVERGGLPPGDIDVDKVGEAAARMAGRRIVLGIRPEALTEAGADGDPGVSTLEAVIEVLEPTGADTFAMMSVGGREIAGRLRPGRGSAGAVGRFDVDASKILLFDPETERRLD